jgi:hypothetical protein
VFQTLEQRVIFLNISGDKMLKRINFMTLFIVVILVYTTTHVSEEACGNFPLFMIKNWGIPDIGFGQWLFHNIALFLPTILIGLLIYSLDYEKYLPFGVGISIWGIINFFEHTFYTVKNVNVSPGFFSSILFLLLGVIIFIKLKQIGRLNLQTIFLSVTCSIFYWAIPIFLIFTLSDPITRIFH